MIIGTVKTIATTGIKLINKVPKEAWYIVYGMEIDNTINKLFDKNRGKGLPKKWETDIMRTLGKCNCVEKAQ